MPEHDIDDTLEDHGSCDECGCDLDPDESMAGLCDQCAWWLHQAGEE